MLFLSYDAAQAILISKNGTPSESNPQCVEQLLAPTTSDGEYLTVTVGGVTFKMVYVAAGTFTMGATPEQEDPEEAEKPAHQVTLTKDYYLGETEVTQALWREVMGSNPSYLKGDDLPVEQVCWDDCQVFIHRLNELTGRQFRLPTEAEWEYAARGGVCSRGYQYAGGDTTESCYWDNGANKPVKSFSPNELGIYDMSGNVWEWCQDWFGPYSSASQINPTGLASGSSRVVRGGCSASITRCWRVAYRGDRPSSEHYPSLGFRLALSK